MWFYYRHYITFQAEPFFWCLFLPLLSPTSLPTLISFVNRSITSPSKWKENTGYRLRVLVKHQQSFRTEHPGLETRRRSKESRSNGFRCEVTPNTFWQRNQTPSHHGYGLVFELTYLETKKDEEEHISSSGESQIGNDCILCL